MTWATPPFVPTGIQPDNNVSSLKLGPKDGPGTYKRLLPPVPQHIQQPSPCCHMYHSVGGCVDSQAVPQDKEEPDAEEEAV